MGKYVVDGRSWLVISSATGSLSTGACNKQPSTSQTGGFIGLALGLGSQAVPEAYCQAADQMTESHGLGVEESAAGGGRGAGGQVFRPVTPHHHHYFLPSFVRRLAGGRRLTDDRCWTKHRAGRSNLGEFVRQGWTPSEVS